MSYPKLATLFAVCAMCLSGTVVSAADDSMTEDQKVFYFLGTALSANLVPLNLWCDQALPVNR